MLLSAVSVLVVAQSSSEIPEGLMNNPVLCQCLAHMNREKSQRIIRMAGVRADNRNRNLRKRRRNHNHWTGEFSGLYFFSYFFDFLSLRV